MYISISLPLHSQGRVFPVSKFYDSLDQREKVIKIYTKSYAHLNLPISDYFVEGVRFETSNQAKLFGSHFVFAIPLGSTFTTTTLDKAQALNYTA